MQFQGKKIGLATTRAQLKNTAVLKGVLREMEGMLTEGAELLVILLDAMAQREAQGANSSSLAGLLQRLRPAAGGEKGAGTAASRPGPGGAGSGPVSSLTLDLLVVVSGFAGALEDLARLAPEDCPAVPLLVLFLPCPGEEPALSRLSSLLGKKGVYFVPFGPLNGGLQRDSKGGPPPFCSRIDLLGAACAAALAGCQLKPFIWDNHSFPH